MMDSNIKYPHFSQNVTGEVKHETKLLLMAIPPSSWKHPKRTNVSGDGKNVLFWIKYNAVKN